MTAQIWGIIWLVWQNSFFHWAVLLLFLIATVIEIWIVLTYWFSDCRLPMSLVRYLKSLNQGGLPTKEKQTWLNNYIKFNQGKPVKQSNQFVLVQYPSVLNRTVPRSHMRFIPTILTALGILGTFYGIQVGLRDISPELASSQELLSSSKTLFEGMRTAFSTSLMGLGSSSLFTIILFLGDLLRQKRRDNLRKQLNQLAFLESPEQILSQIDFAANREAAVVLKQAASHMAKLNPESLGMVIGQQVGMALDQAIVTHLSPVFREISDSLGELRKLKEDQGEKVLENLIQSLRVEVLEPLTDRLDKSTALTEQASVAVTTLTQELGTISQSLSQSVLTIQRFQQDTLVRLHQFAASLKETLTQFQTDTKDVLQLTAQEIRQGTVEILDRAEATFEQQSKTLEVVGTEASKLMHDARNTLVGSLQNIDGMLQNTSQMVQGELQHFRQEYQAALQTFFMEQNNLLNGTLGEQRKGLAEVVETLNITFREEADRRRALAQEIDRSMQMIKDAAAEVGKLAIADGMNWELRLRELQEAARGISQHLQELEKTYRETLNYLESYMDKSNSIQSNFFNEADIAIARVSSSLLETVKVLVAVKDDRQLRNGGNGHGVL